MKVITISYSKRQLALQAYNNICMGNLSILNTRVIVANLRCDKKQRTESLRTWHLVGCPVSNGGGQGEPGGEVYSRQLGSLSRTDSSLVLNWFIYTSKL